MLVELVEEIEVNYEKFMTEMKIFHKTKKDLGGKQDELECS